MAVSHLRKVICLAAFLLLDYNSCVVNAWRNRINPDTSFYDGLQDFIEFTDLQSQLLLKKWPNTIQEADNWPYSPLDPNIKQVTGIAVGDDDTVHIFHRGSRVWDINSFDFYTNKFKQIEDGPIPNDTVIVYDEITGEIKSTWGANRFYMPHGITIDKKGNTWITDVALHQVFKFEPGATEPSIVLGEALVPGGDKKHFCKPTDVAVISNGDFFVSDGYCNSRIVMFDEKGTFLMEFATKDWLTVPHGLSLDEDNNCLYVADRENYRILCYSALPSKGRVGIKNTSFDVRKGTMGRVFGVAQAGESIFAITGSGDEENVPANALLQVNRRGDVIKTWRPIQAKFLMPHDIALNSKRSNLYIVDCDERATKKIYKLKLLNK